MHTTDTPAVSPTDQPGPEKWFALEQRLDAEIRVAERVIAQQRAANEAALDAFADGMSSPTDVERTLEQSMERGRALAEQQSELDAKRRLSLGVKDRLFEVRVEARERGTQEAQERIDAFDIDLSDLRAQMAELARAHGALQERLGVVLDQQKRAAEELSRRAIASNRLIGPVFLASVSPWSPPSDVLVRATAWFHAIEEARAAGFVAVRFTINESLGVVTRCVPDQSLSQL
jgi:hypothetical protein